MGKRHEHPIGIDFGGTGIKAAPVDLDNGELAADKERVATPKPATPDAVADVIVELVDRFEPKKSSIGVTVPGVVRDGVVGSAANIDPSWIDVDADALLTERLGRDVHVVNDADAAGLAEAKYGAARKHDGLVVVTTLGTGIGSALLYRGHLVPNTELGHVELHDDSAEKYAANSAREREGLSWEEWAGRLTEYYSLLERLFSPDLFVVGGGVSKESEKFLPLLEIHTEIVPAKLHNKAGIIGAALLTG